MQNCGQTIGLLGKWPPLLLQDSDHYLRPAANRGPFLAVTRLAMKRQQPLSFGQYRKPDFSTITVDQPGSSHCREHHYRGGREQQAADTGTRSQQLARD